MADQTHHVPGCVERAARMVIIEETKADYKAESAVESRVHATLLNVKRIENKAQLDAATAKALADYDRGEPLDLVNPRTVHAAADAQAMSEFETALDLMLDRLDGKALPILQAIPYPPAYGYKRQAERAARKANPVHPVPGRVQSAEYVRYMLSLRSDESVEHRVAWHKMELDKGNVGRVKMMHHAARFRAVETADASRTAYNEVRRAENAALNSIMAAEARIIKGADSIDLSDPRIVRSWVHDATAVPVSSCLPVHALYAALANVGVVEGLGVPEAATYCKYCSLCFGPLTTTAAIEQKWRSTFTDKIAILVRQCPENPLVRCCDAVVPGRVYRGFELAEMREKHDARLKAEEERTCVSEADARELARLTDERDTVVQHRADIDIVTAELAALRASEKEAESKKRRAERDKERGAAKKARRAEGV